MGIRNTHMRTNPFPGVGVSGGLTIEQLNTLIPYSSFFLEAGEFTASANLPAIWHPIQINAQEQALGAWECVYGNQSEVFCIKDLKGCCVNWADPQFKIRPVFCQIDDVTAPDPVEYALWSSAVLNVTMGNSYDRTNNTFEYSMLSPVVDAWDKAGGKAADLEASIAITAINGDAFSLTGSNSVLFEIERHSGGGYVSDTYEESVYLFGIGVQYKTNFANNAVWSV